MSACATVFVKTINPSKVDLSFPRDFGFSPSLICKFHPKYSPQVDTIPIGSLIVDVSIIMIGMLKNTKRKLMVGLAFTMFVPTASECYDGRWTISALTESHAKTILMISYLAFGLFCLKAW